MCNGDRRRKTSNVRWGNLRTEYPHRVVSRGAGVSRPTPKSRRSTLRHIINPEPQPAKPCAKNTWEYTYMKSIAEGTRERKRRDAHHIIPMTQFLLASPVWCIRTPPLMSIRKNTASFTSPLENSPASQQDCLAGPMQPWYGPAPTRDVAARVRHTAPGAAAPRDTPDIGQAAGGYGRQPCRGRSTTAAGRTRHQRAAWCC